MAQRGCQGLFAARFSGPMAVMAPGPIVRRDRASASQARGIDSRCHVFKGELHFGCQRRLYRALTLAERVLISRSMAAGCSIRQITAWLGRLPSTVKSPALGACPTLTVLLRQTMRNRLRRSRPKKILNVFQRIRLRFFQALRRSPARTSFASSRRQCRTGS